MALKMANWSYVTYRKPTYNSYNCFFWWLTGVISLIGTVHITFFLRVPLEKKIHGISCVSHLQVPGPSLCLATVAPLIVRPVQAHDSFASIGARVLILLCWDNSNTGSTYSRRFTNTYTNVCSLIPTDHENYCIAWSYFVRNSYERTHIPDLFTVLTVGRWKKWVCCDG